MDHHMNANEISRPVLEGMERDFLLNKTYLVVYKECGYMFLLCMKRSSSTQDVYNEIHEIYPEYQYNRLVFMDRNNATHYLPNVKGVNFFEWCVERRLASCTSKELKMAYQCTIENSYHNHNSNNNINHNINHNIG
jgi:hypothetical protein